MDYPQPDVEVLHYDSTRKLKADLHLQLENVRRIDSDYSWMVRLRQILRSWVVDKTTNLPDILSFFLEQDESKIKGRHDPVFRFRTEPLARFMSKNFLLYDLEENEEGESMKNVAGDWMPSCGTLTTESRRVVYALKWLVNCGYEIFLVHNGRYHDLTGRVHFGGPSLLGQPAAGPFTSPGAPFVAVGATAADLGTRCELAVTIFKSARFMEMVVPIALTRGPVAIDLLTRYLFYRVVYHASWERGLAPYMLYSGVMSQAGVSQTLSAKAIERGLFLSLLYFQEESFERLIRSWHNLQDSFRLDVSLFWFEKLGSVLSFMKPAPEDIFKFRHGFDALLTRVPVEDVHIALMLLQKPADVAKNPRNTIVGWWIQKFIENITTGKSSTPLESSTADMNLSFDLEGTGVVAVFTAFRGFGLGTMNYDVARNSKGIPSLCLRKVAAKTDPAVAYASFDYDFDNIMKARQHNSRFCLAMVRQILVELIRNKTVSDFKARSWYTSFRQHALPSINIMDIAVEAGGCEDPQRAQDPEDDTIREEVIEPMQPGVIARMFLLMIHVGWYEEATDFLLKFVVQNLMEGVGSVFENLWFPLLNGIYHVWISKKTQICAEESAVASLFSDIVFVALTFYKFAYVGQEPARDFTRARLKCSLPDGSGPCHSCSVVNTFLANGNSKRQILAVANGAHGASDTLTNTTVSEGHLTHIFPQLSRHGRFCEHRFRTTKVAGRILLLEKTGDDTKRKAWLQRKAELTDLTTGCYHRLLEESVLEDSFLSTPLTGTERKPLQPEEWCQLTPLDRSATWRLLRVPLGSNMWAEERERFEEALAKPILRFNESQNGKVYHMRTGSGLEVTHRARQDVWESLDLD